MIEKSIYSAKTVELAVQDAIQKTGQEENKLIINVIQEPVKGILGIGNKPAEVEVVQLEDVYAYAKQYLVDLIKKMGFEAQIEVIKRNDNISFNVFSNHNPLLIGKQGKTLAALQKVLQQSIKNQIGKYISITLDIGGYKGNQKSKLEKIAHRVSRSVAKSKTDAKLDPMNAYERRIVHTYLADDKFVYTTSEGQDPNRYVVIKYKRK